MPKEAVFTLKLEPELSDVFINAAEAAHRPASQVIRELMRDFIQIQAHDAWFRAKVEQGLRKPRTRRPPGFQLRKLRLIVGKAG